MSGSRIPLLAAGRRPEYTGANRCWPCTIGNVALLLGGCGLLASVSIPLAALAAVTGLATIWLRGFLIPYTPAITSSVLESVSWRSGYRPQPDAGSGPGHELGPELESEPEPEPKPGSLARSDDVAPERILEALVDADVLTVTPESVAPTAAFREQWDREMEMLREATLEDLAEATLEAAPRGETVDAVRDGDGGDREYVVLTDGSDRYGGESWIRRPTAIGQTAALRILTDRDVPDELRDHAAVSLGFFLETCPSCESAVDERAAGGCCGPPRTTADGEVKTALVCEACRVQLHVLE